jgi:hypothetical protein
MRLTADVLLVSGHICASYQHLIIEINACYVEGRELPQCLQGARGESQRCALFHFGQC